MRLLSVCLSAGLLSACISSSSPPTASAPATAPEPAPAKTAETPETEQQAGAMAWAEGTWHEVEPGHAGVIEALGSAGACRSADMEKPSRALSWTVSGQALYAAMCESYAYQADWEWWIETQDGFVAVKDAAGRPVRFLGMPSVAPGEARVSWLTKDRGAGGCGSWHLLALDGGMLKSIEHRSRACDPDPEPPPPEQWPLVDAGSGVGAFPDAAAVQAAAGGTVEPIVSELSSETIGQKITRAEPGPVGGVPCGPVVQTYDDTWGCETTEAFSHSGYTSTGWASLHYGNGARANLIASNLVPPMVQLDVSGVPCTVWAHLHPDGSLASCQLRAAHTFGSLTLPIKTDVELRPDGTVEGAVIYEDVQLGDKTLEAGTFAFAPDGTVNDHNAGWFGD